MTANQEDQFFDVEDMEKWLETYFLDPLTSYYDQTQFRIDLYETEKEWIVEALLNDYTSSDISVFVEDNQLIIKGKKNLCPSKNDHQPRLRTIEFPFHVKNQKITANFQNGILEVFISKKDKGLGKSRFITLP